MKHSYPYIKYEETPLWHILKKALNDLVKNQDVLINTREEYIIGYLCDKISNSQINNNIDNKG